MRASIAIAALVSAVSVRAVDHLVKVGASGLAFDPTSVQAAQGDTVTFEFHPKNHSVTQSTFAAPCTPMPNGANSGFLATDPSATQFSQWQITIDNASAPLWFFCAQTTPAPHCGQGMVFAINDTPEKSFAMFQQTAKNTAANGAAAPPAAGSSSAAGGAPPADTAAASTGAGAGATPATGGAPVAGATNTPGATNVGAPIAGATSGSVPAGAIPSAASGLPISASGSANGATSSGGAGSGALPRVSSGFTLSSTLALAGVVALLL